MMIMQAGGVTRGIRIRHRLVAISSDEAGLKLSQEAQAEWVLVRVMEIRVWAQMHSWNGAEARASSKASA